MRRVIVVGGGVSGLTLAYRLERLLPAAEVLVLERDARLGGKVGTLRDDGYRVEAGPNGFLDNKSAVLDLCRDLGLADRLIAASDAAGRNRFLLLRGRLHKLPGGLLSFLTAGVLSWRAKLALLTERFRRNRPADEDESVDAFARRRAGAEVAETLADAFVTGIWGGDPSLLSVRATFPRLAELEREHGSVLGGLARARRQRRRDNPGKPASRPRMWSFREGLGLLIATLRSALRTPPLTGVGVRRLVPEAGRWRVEAEGRDALDADAVALTCPAFAQAELLADCDAELAAEVGAIVYNRIVVVAVAYRRGDVPHPLDGFGYLTPQRERRDVLGVQWCSSIFPERTPPDAVLLRALCGGWHRGDIVEWDDDRLVRTVADELRAVLGVRGEPLFSRVVRWPRAIPQYHVGHLARLERIEALRRRHAGLYVGGSAYRGVALTDCVEQAGLLAARMAAESAGR